MFITLGKGNEKFDSSGEVVVLVDMMAETGAMWCDVNPVALFLLLEAARHQLPSKNS